MTQHDAASFSALVDQQLDAAQRGLDALLELPSGATAEEVSSTFDGIGKEIGEVSGLSELFSAVHPDEAVREAAEVASQRISAFVTELNLHRGAYERFANLDLEGEHSADVRRYVEHALRDYRRSGVDKDDATRERVRALQEELIHIGQEFDRNIMTGGRSLRLDEGHGALAGLPADFLAAHPEDADGSVTLTTDPTDFLPVMLYAERDDVRRDLHREFNLRAFPENAEVLDRLLAKRHELAKTLGYDHWAHWACEDKMVGTAEAAREFAERVSARARPVGEAEFSDLLAELRTIDPAAERVDAWQSRYLAERVKRRKHSFDSQSVRPYFAYAKVRDGILATTETLFGVRIERSESGSPWHETVECFDVFEGDRAVARFYLDMFPRDGKFKHAAMFQVRSGVSGGAIPEAALVCNFPAPTEGDPALLLHDQVTTFFHEVGHLLHHLFSTHRFHGFAGIACEWDFVEVPSQLYEEWAWSAGVLQQFATHHETGEPIPGELVAKLRAAEEYGKGMNVMGQMLYALFALTLYDRDPAGVDPGQLLGDLQKELTFFEKVPGTAMQCAFGHLHGYSSNYYTYMWSLVISKDFASVFGDDLMSTEKARRYRETVLGQGGSDDAGVMAAAFLGRETSFEAWESWLQA